MVLQNYLKKLPIINLSSTILASFVETKSFGMNSLRRYRMSQLNMILFVIGFLTFFTFIGITNCAPIDSENRQKPLSEQLRTEGVGNPSELAWQAWLLIDTDEKRSNSDNLDSASLLRRITPKSIFIAPPLQACADGYQPDAMNRCVKTVSINQEAHIDFLLQRLNAMYANFGNPPPSKSDTSPASSGPFHIPLFVDTDQKGETEKENGNDSEKKTSLSKEENTEKESEKPDDKKEAVLTIYEDVKNESTGIEQLIPVMEFVEEIDSNLSDILDFKSPTVDDKVSNKSENENSSNKTENIGEVIENKVNNTDQISNASAASIHPTLFLLLPPTNSPIANFTKDIKINDNVSLKRVEINFESKNNESANEEIIRIRLPLTTTEPPTTLPPVKLILNVSESLENTTEIETEVYDEDNEYTTESSTEYTTEKEILFEDQTEEYEESTENDDEILKHSEAGSMVTYSSTKFPHIKTTFVENRENESKISGEVIVSKDFIRETTLVGLNIDKINQVINNNNKTNSNEKNISSNKNDLEKNPNDNKYQDKLSTVEETTPWSTTWHEMTTAETTERSTILPIPTVNQLSLVDNSPGVLSIEEAMEKENMPQKTPTIRSSATPHVTPSQNTSEVELFSKLSDSKTSETMTASSSNTAEMFMPQKSIGPNVQGNVEPPKPPKTVVSFQPTGFKFPSTTVGQMNAYNYYASPQAYSHYQYPVQNNNNQFVLKPVNGQKSDSVKNFDLKRKDYVNFQHPAFYQIRNRDHVKFPTFSQPQSQPSYVRFPSQEANSIHTSNDFKEKTYQQQYSQPAYHLMMKTPYWPVAPNYRTNRQQLPQRVVPGYQIDKKKQDRQSPVLGFWTRMPLVQDLTSVQQQQPQSNAFVENDSMDIDPRINAARRISYYKELSPPNGTRSYARSTPVRR